MTTSLDNDFGRRIPARLSNHTTTEAVYTGLNPRFAERYIHLGFILSNFYPLAAETSQSGLRRTNMEECRIREIFNAVLLSAKEKGQERDFITDEELAKYYPIMGCNAKRIRYHVNHSGLKAAGRVNKACVFGIKEVLGAIEWKKAQARRGV